MKTSEEAQTREETVLLKDHCEADQNENKHGTGESETVVNSMQIKASEETTV